MLRAMTAQHNPADLHAASRFVSPRTQGEKQIDDSMAAIPLLMEAKRFWDSLEDSNLKAGVVGKINMKFMQLCRDRDILKKVILPVTSLLRATKMHN